MKKIFICLAVMAFCCLPVLADGEEEKKPVTIRPINILQNSQMDDYPRSPIRRPSLYIEDHTLSFTNSCVGYTLELVQDDEVVYTYFINSTDDLVLPSNLTGIYEIRLVGGAFTFVGEIEL